MLPKKTKNVGIEKVVGRWETEDGKRNPIT
jgi:hypothetical protein